MLRWKVTHVCCLKTTPSSCLEFPAEYPAVKDMSVLRLPMVSSTIWSLSWPLAVVSVKKPLKYQQHVSSASSFEYENESKVRRIAWKLLKVTNTFHVTSRNFLFYYCQQVYLEFLSHVITYILIRFTVFI